MPIVAAASWRCTTGSRSTGTIPVAAIRRLNLHLAAIRVYVRCATLFRRWQLIVLTVAPADDAQKDAQKVGRRGAPKGGTAQGRNEWRKQQETVLCCLGTAARTILIDSYCET